MVKSKSIISHKALSLMRASNALGPAEKKIKKYTNNYSVVRKYSKSYYTAFRAAI